MLIKYIWNNPTLVRSNGIKINIKKGKTFEVNQKEYQNLKWSYKNLFDFNDLSDDNIKNDKVTAETKKEAKVEVIEAVATQIETVEDATLTIEVINEAVEILEDKKVSDDPFND